MPFFHGEIALHPTTDLVIAGELQTALQLRDVPLAFRDQPRQKILSNLKESTCRN